MAGASSCLNSAVAAPLRDRRVTHYSHVVPDRFCTELGLNTTGAAITWSCAGSALRLRGAGCGAQRTAAGSPAGGPRRPWRMRRCSCPSSGTGSATTRGEGGLPGDVDRHTRAAMAFAVIEGIAFGVCEALAVLERAGSPVRELRVGGGGAT